MRIKRLRDMLDNNDMFIRVDLKHINEDNYIDCFREWCSEGYEVLIHINENTAGILLRDESDFEKIISELPEGFRFTILEDSYSKPDVLTEYGIEYEDDFADSTEPAYVVNESYKNSPSRPNEYAAQPEESWVEKQLNEAMTLTSQGGHSQLKSREEIQRVKKMSAEDARRQEIELMKKLYKD